MGRGSRVPGPEDCFCPTNSLLPRFPDPKGFGRRVPANSLPGVPKIIRTWSSCKNESYVTYQCSELPLLPPRLPPSTPVSVAEAAVRGGIDIYVATSDHSGHGLFALLERVLNQLHHARQLGMEPFVFLGAYSFMEPQACEYARSTYHSPSHGENAWEYWFRQPGGYRLGAATVRGRWVRSLQVSAVDIVAYQGPVTGYGRTDTYDWDRLSSSRAIAHSLLGDLGANLVRPELRSRALEIFGAWRRRSRHILGVHMRGTDKVVRRKVPPEAYFVFIDAYLNTYPDALVLVATDDHAYLQRMKRRYGGGGSQGASQGGMQESSLQGRLVRRRESVVYRKDPFGEGRGRGGYLRGEDVLLDALLLAQCDFLLKSSSAVAEFALWVRPQLQSRHLDLQVSDRFASQSLPAWTRRLGQASAVADLYCDRLHQACANETMRRYGGRRYCHHCDPLQI